MENELYVKTFVVACNATDGETPTQVVVTEEFNGYAVFFRAADEETRLLQWFWRTGRNKAIEFAVGFSIP